MNMTVKHNSKQTIVLGCKEGFSQENVDRFLNDPENKGYIVQITPENNSERSKEINAKRELLEPMAERMLEIRLRKGMKQKEFGEYLASLSRMGDNPYTLMMVSSVENARRCYELETYIALAKNLQVSLDYLFGRTDNRGVYPPSKGFRDLIERVDDVTDDFDIPELGVHGTESRLVLADKLKVPLDYLCGLTDEIYIH